MLRTKNHEPTIRYEALDRCVLVVAVEGEMNDWAAYIGAVKGQDHETEYQEIARCGTKINHKMARLLFPTFDAEFAWRE